MKSISLRRESAPVPPFASELTAANVPSPRRIEEYKAALGEGGFAVIDCYADWCGPCKAIAPKVEELAHTHPEVRFYQVDVDASTDVAQELGIRAMPTFKFFHNGDVADEIVGANPAALVAAVQKGAKLVKDSA